MNPRYTRMADTSGRGSSTPEVSITLSSPSTLSTAISPLPGGEILFLRQHALWSINLTNWQQRMIIDDIVDFAATPDGEQIALIGRDGYRQAICTIQRDGTNLVQHTYDDLAK